MNWNISECTIICLLSEFPISGNLLGSHFGMFAMENAETINSTCVLKYNKMLVFVFLCIVHTVLQGILHVQIYAIQSSHAHTRPRLVGAWGSVLL